MTNSLKNYVFKIYEGARCEICIPLPGCEQGTCDNALECNCEDQWAGAYCEIRKIFFFKLHGNVHHIIKHFLFC